MPGYDFQCQKCRKKFALTMSITEYAERKRIRCPKCKSSSVQRVLQAFSAQTGKKS